MRSSRVREEFTFSLTSRDGIFSCILTGKRIGASMIDSAFAFATAELNDFHKREDRYLHRLCQTYLTEHVSFVTFDESAITLTS